MSTFSRSTFNATRYAASRPHYPRALYDHVLDYASLESTSTGPRTLVDVGCGPGLSTFEFASPPAHFDKIIGVDPSSTMIDAAKSIQAQKEEAGENKRGTFTFERGKVDELRGIEDESVDLVVAGQAAHWFDPQPSYESLARVLKPGGSFVFWGYGEIFFPQRPELSALIPPYSGQLLGTAPYFPLSIITHLLTSCWMGPYWEQPGRSIVENLLIPFPLPVSSNFSSQIPPDRTRTQSICDAFDRDSLKRAFYLSNPSQTPELRPAERDAGIIISTGSLLLTKQWTVKGLEGYLRTWSSLHKYREENGSQPDIVEGLIRDLKEKGWKDGEDVEAAWEVGMVMGKKKRRD
ncbi:class I SAM-dependent methyltransferase [Sporobolomyces salmoneus]|uniref:class I SAM-dependent methyltransferase n=1 Tax=Sporobolomyces salmoneus TaxID=183962 RepID=UPI00317301A8